MKSGNAFSAAYQQPVALLVMIVCCHCQEAPEVVWTGRGVTSCTMQRLFHNTAGCTWYSAGWLPIICAVHAMYLDGIDSLSAVV